MRPRVLMLVVPRVRGMGARLRRAVVMLALGAAAPLHAQAPLGIFGGKWIEAGVTAHSVTNDLGDWRGAWVRTVIPAGTRNTVWADALALEAFGERGVQVGLAHRHDWSGRFFHLAGVTVADGAPIFPRVRADLQAGVRLGAARTVVAAAGVSHVRSVQDLSDAALTGALAWYAPRGFILETGVRANTSWPGRIRTARFSGGATWMGARRSFSVRGIGGEEGWQVLSAQTALVRFSSNEWALSWRERFGAQWSSAVQFDRYDNPTYARTGLTIGLARSW
jgi:YaiO family outer membrane protein